MENQMVWQDEYNIGVEVIDKSRRVPFMCLPAAHGRR